MKEEVFGVTTAKDHEYHHWKKPDEDNTVGLDIPTGKKPDWACIEYPVRKFVYDFLKTYLYALQDKTLTNESLEVTHFSIMASVCQPAVINPRVYITDENGLALIHHDIVYAYLKFESRPYQVTVYRTYDSNRHTNTIQHYISVLGYKTDSPHANRLIETLISESIRNSYYKNKILNVQFIDGEISIGIADGEEFKHEDLKNLFIPQNTMSELTKFVQCAERFPAMQKNLRFLLSGEPGTGKTKAIRSLIHACKGKATIIIAKSDIEFSALFAFAANFQAAILCFDDLDLAVGTRENGFYPRTLSDFLQELDGFEKNSVFVLATTNDKNLVDKAASRPGRFDMILDFGRLGKENYMDLVRSVKPHTGILNIFDEEFLIQLKKKKVTGAFLVNLVKQLEIKRELEPEADLRQYVKDYFELSHRGFYKKPDEKELSFGFNGHDE